MLCVSMYAPLSTFALLNQYLLLMCISWQLSPSQRCTSEIPDISNDSVKRLENLRTATSTHVKTEELSYGSFSMVSVYYKLEVGD